MSIQLQVAIPLFVTFAVLAAIAGWRRYFKPEIFIIGACVLSMGAFMTVEHISAANDVSESGVSASVDTDELSLTLAEQYMLDEQYAAAMDVLENLLQSNGSNPNVKLAAARCSLLQGDYSAAVQMYEQLSDRVEDELTHALSLLASTQVNSNAIVAYLQKLGYDPAEYGLEESAEIKADYDDAQELIRERLHKDLDAFENTYGDSAVDALEYASDLTAEFDACLQGQQSSDSLESTVRKLDTAIKEAPELADNADLRLARLKGYVLSGDYDKIAESADRSCVSEELVVLSQLFVSGLVDDKDFSDAYVDLDFDRYQEVLGICRQNLKEADLTKDQEEKYNEKLEQLQDQMDDPVLFTLRQDLLEQVEEGDTAMQSKCYLALAKIENACGNEQQADIYISKALGTAGNSDDENYRIPMNQMADILQGNSETSEILNIAQYVDAALDHSLPLDIQVSDITALAGSAGELGDQMTNTVTKNTASINIGVIDAGEFPVVQASVQIQSSQWDTVEELMEHLNVYDCGTEITEFTLEKLEFQSSRIILLCDCSGSMDDSVNDLKQVIADFAASMRIGEEVCVIGFNSGIAFVKPFSSDPTEVAGAADSIFASGGTALFDSLIYAGEQHTQDINANNIIIAMTDGQDGSYVTEEQMYSQISTMAAQKGLTVYTVGLGDVDADYLQKMAQFGNGSFLYADDSEDLQTFYDFIHGQLSNQYILTYTAKNLTRNERTVELSLDGEMGSKIKTYYLQEPGNSDTQSSAENPYAAEPGKLSVGGLSAQLLYKSSQDQTLMLLGSSFNAADEVTVRLVGSVKYDLSATFIDSSSYAVVIPSEIAVGVYDLEVSIGDCSFSLEDELTVAVAGSTRNFQYGAYSFTAQTSYINDSGETVLSGNVVMNGWLRFKGDLTISYDYYDGGKAWITDESGFYVSYSESAATGLAGIVAEWGVPIQFGAMGKFSICDDPYIPGDYEDFDVFEKNYPAIVSVNMMYLDCSGFNLAIYPDMLWIQNADISFSLPLQEQLMRCWKQCPDKRAAYDSAILIGAREIAFVETLEFEDLQDASLMMLHQPLRLISLKIAVNTLKNDYTFTAGVGLEAISDVDGFTFTVGFADGKFDSFGLRLKDDDIALPLVKTPVPVEMSNFGFLVSGFGKYNNSGDAVTALLDYPVTIEFDIDVANLNKYVPDLAKLLDDEGDVAVATLSDSKLQMQLKDFRLAFDANLVFIEVLDLGKVHVSAGDFDYTNKLLGFYKEDAVGMQIAVEADLVDMDTKNLDLELNGQIEACLSYPYTGLWLNGNASYHVGWWIIGADGNITGDALIGAYENSSGNFQFSVILRGENSEGKYSGFHAYLTFEEGFQVYQFD